MENKALLRACPLCQHPFGWVLYHQAFETPEDYPLPREYDLVCCSQCGFVFADVGVAQDDYTRYYQEIAKYEASEATTNWHKSTLKPLTKYVKKDASILDIGCATGQLLGELKKAGYTNLAGLDLSPSCLKKVEKQGFRAFQGNFLSCSLEEKFDCLILSHVLEHVYDLQRAREVLFSFLKIGGILYAEVPDSTRYFDYYLSPFHFFDAEHINHFTMVSLNALFTNFQLLESQRKESYVANKKYPAVYSLYQKKPTIADYINKSIEKDHWPEIDKLAKSQEPIAVWGVGSYTMRLLKNTPLGKCHISFFIDKDKKKKGWQLKGAEVFSDPHKLKKHSGPVVVCSALYHEEIAEEIKKMKLSNRIVIMK